MLLNLTLGSGLTEICGLGTGRHQRLQIGNGRCVTLGRDLRHASMIGWRVFLGQNFGTRTARRQVAFQYSPARDRDFRFFAAFATALMSPDSG